MPCALEYISGACWPDAHAPGLQVLSEDCYLDRKNEVPKGKKPFYTLPVFNHHKVALQTLHQMHRKCPSAGSLLHMLPERWMT